MPTKKKQTFNERIIFITTTKRFPLLFPWEWILEEMWKNVI